MLRNLPTIDCRWDRLSKPEPNAVCPCVTTWAPVRPWTNNLSLDRDSNPASIVQGLKLDDSVKFQNGIK